MRNVVLVFVTELDEDSVDLFIFAFFPLQQPHFPPSIQVLLLDSYNFLKLEFIIGTNGDVLDFNH
jgi:hypothetical protein